MKKRKKLKLLIIPLALILVCLYVFSTHFQYSVNFKGELKTDFFGTLRDYPIWEYYSKSPSWYTISGTADDSYFVSHIYHVKYLGRFRFDADNDGYLFILLGEMLRNEYVKYNELLTVRSKSDHKNKIFHGELTVMHEYYDVGFEFGQEYAIFTDQVINKKEGYEYHRFTSGCEFAPLDGEYPYIEIFPGKIRYDATHFGAETKYVSKEEFIRFLGVRRAYLDPVKHSTS